MHCMVMMVMMVVMVMMVMRSADCRFGSRRAQVSAQSALHSFDPLNMNVTHHVNVSPKASAAALAVLDAHTLVFADLSGSGAETAAHVLQNGRVTFMFCNLEAGPPQIVRVYGASASIVLPEEAPPALLAAYATGSPARRKYCYGDLACSPGLRAYLVVRVHRVASSCGYSLPVLRYERPRTKLDDSERPAGRRGQPRERRGRQ